MKNKPKIKRLTESKESIKLQEQCKELGINNLIWNDKFIKR